MGISEGTLIWFEVIVGMAVAFVNNNLLNNLLYAVRGLDAGQKRLPIDWKWF